MSDSTHNIDCPVCGADMEVVEGEEVIPRELKDDLIRGWFWERRYVAVDQSALEGLLHDVGARLKDASDPTRVIAEYVAPPGPMLGFDSTYYHQPIYLSGHGAAEVREATEKSPLDSVYEWLSVRCEVCAGSTRLPTGNGCIHCIEHLIEALAKALDRSRMWSAATRAAEDEMVGVRADRDKWKQRANAKRIGYIGEIADDLTEARSRVAVLEAALHEIVDIYYHRHEADAETIADHMDREARKALRGKG